MKKISFLSTALFVLAGILQVTPLNEAAAQSWKIAAITYKDSKDKGKLAAEYKIEPQRGAKNRCRLTLRLTNKTDRTIAHYWFKFTFNEGHKHENSITDHSPGKSEELTYGSCGVRSIEISEVE